MDDKLHDVHEQAVDSTPAEETDLSSPSNVTPHDASSHRETDSYLDDDEAFLRGDDSQVSLESALGVFTQEEGVVAWEIVNLFKENGKLRSKRELRFDPPLLKIQSSSEDYVEFVLTKDFNRTLAQALKKVDEGFYGVDGFQKKLTLQDRKTLFLGWLSDNKGKGILLGLLALLVLVGLFVF